MKKMFYYLEVNLKMVYKMVAQKYIFQMVNYIVKLALKMGNKQEFKKITMKW